MPVIKVKVGNPVVEQRNRVETGGTWDETWTERRGDYQDFLGVKGITGENIKIKLLFMKKGKSKNLLMALWNILIGERLEEILDQSL